MRSDAACLARSRARYAAAVAAGVPLSRIAQHSIGWVYTEEGAAAERAWMAEVFRRRLEKRLRRMLDLRSHVGWALCKQFGQSCRDVKERPLSGRRKGE